MASLGTFLLTFVLGHNYACMISSIALLCHHLGEDRTIKLVDAQSCMPNGKLPRPETHGK